MAELLLTRNFYAIHKTQITQERSEYDLMTLPNKHCQQQLIYLLK